ncbi:MAG: HEAT repeat domain-containing protein [Planctomycetaceae bacterium]|nr:HEAT repeat domain-containing protein [Planctomycetaceae bacterium]
MIARSFRVQALVAVLSVSMCGCSIVGLGYRAGHTRGSGKSEAARLTQLAELYERQGHPSGAMRLYRQAIHADPRSQQARERLMALSSQHASPPQSPAAKTPSLLPDTAPVLAGSRTAPQTVAAHPAQSQPGAARPIAAAEPARARRQPVRATPMPPPQSPAQAAPPVLKVAQSAAAAAAAAAAAPMPRTPVPTAVATPVVEATPAPLTVPAAVAAIAPGVVQRAPLPPAEPMEVVEAPVSLAVEVQPLPALPQPVAVVQPAPLAPATEWTTTTHSPAVSQAPAALSAPSETGIDIRPRPVDDSPAIVRMPNVVWAPTDLTRLCPSASESLLSIVRRLESAHPSDRKDALIELAEIGESAQPVMAAVRSVMHDPEHSVRAHAAWAVCRIEGVNAECVQVLADVLGSDDASGAAFAAYCLGLLEQDAQAAVPALESACTSDVSLVRLCAAEALLKITPESAEPVALLIDGLHEPDQQQRWLAALSLSAASSPYQEPAILALTPLLTDDSPDVCSAAALALGAYGANAHQAVPALQGALGHADGDVRDAAAAALDCIEE